MAVFIYVDRPPRLQCDLRKQLICYVLLFSCIVHLIHAKVYTDQFVIKVEEGPEVAKELARKHGFVFIGEALPNFFLLKQSRIRKRSTEPSIHHYNGLQREPQVKWIQQQTLKKRTKRDIYAVTINDERWPQMWYLNRGRGLDMNVQGAWKEGITGKGIVVTILDDGLEKDHPDLADNYDPDASYDVNNHDRDPQPRYDFLDSNRHGTRCAGEVAAQVNNNICAVGIAYKSSIGGVRMLDGDVTDAVEAMSLSLNNQHIDIYSASWGPDDDGKTVDGPGKLATNAFIQGIEKGRRNLGSIFVWASGNGGREHDNCNCDGYTNSIWTLSISSATENGLVPWYSEACSSTLATTYSSGSHGERQIITTDLHHACTSSHTGTSASAPLAAGICALALEANKNLTWRDMQHIVVRTARPSNLFSSDWKVNAVGRNVSHSFGYGLMDAAAMVRLARVWKTVPPQKRCEVHDRQIDKQIPAKSSVKLTLRVQCENVKFLEHVQAKITLTASRRGDIHIYLISPSGTNSTLLAQRPMDNSRSGFQSWPFMTVHSWGENPNGDWKIEIHNEAKFYGRATLKGWDLILHGTATDPAAGTRMPLEPPEVLKPLVSLTTKRPRISTFPHLPPKRVTTPKSNAYTTNPFIHIDSNQLPTLVPQSDSAQSHWDLPPGNQEDTADLVETKRKKQNSGCAVHQSSGLCLGWCILVLFLVVGLPTTIRHEHHFLPALDCFQPAANILLPSLLLGYSAKLWRYR